MKRVQAGCICQTLVFSQKPDMGYNAEQALKLNLAEIEHYKATMERSRTRYQITDTAQQSDGTVIVHVRKQYNDKADVAEYFI